MAGTKKMGPARRAPKVGRKVCGYLGCKHHLGHAGPHTWSEGR